ncbi:MAG: adenine-specific DNA-methyltransferase, partial [Clostridiales bacterium]|nr:adenine-specific DNA-methyltransferase [Clostridiales bacterium]
MDSVYEKDGHKIIWGNALDKLDLIPNESVDLIFIDPPYNIGKNFSCTIDCWETDESYLNWCYSWIDKCIDKLKSSGSLYIMMSTQFMPYIDIYIRNKMTILSRIIWSYDSSGVQAKKFYGSLYEPILYCVKSKSTYTFNASDILVEAKTGSQRKLIDYRKPIPCPYNSKKVPGNVWYFNRVRFRMDEFENHPTQKPVSLLERIIKASSNVGDTVLDPFAGTFTTGYVAKSLKRKSISIEIASEYVKIGLRRLQICDSVDGQMLV